MGDFEVFLASIFIIFIWFDLIKQNYLEVILNQYSYIINIKKRIMLLYQIISIVTFFISFCLFDL